MAHITLSGTLLDPNGDNAVGDKIRFTHKSTTGETVQSAVSVLTIPPDGTYSINLEYGLVLVEYKDITSAQFKNRGVATVNSDNPATSIPELLNAVVPVSSAELIEFQAILADCVTAQTAAETSKTAAETAETAAVAAAAAAVAAAAVVLIPVSEVITLVDGQTLVTFTTLTTDNAEFNINGIGIDSRVLSGQDYNIGLTTTTTITLFDSYPAGSIVTLSKNTSAAAPSGADQFKTNQGASLVGTTSGTSVQQNLDALYSVVDRTNWYTAGDGVALDLIVDTTNDLGITTTGTDVDTFVNLGKINTTPFLPTGATKSITEVVSGLRSVKFDGGSTYDVYAGAASYAAGMFATTKRHVLMAAWSTPNILSGDQTPFSVGSAGASSPRLNLKSSSNGISNRAEYHDGSGIITYSQVALQRYNNQIVDECVFHNGVDEVNHWVNGAILELNEPETALATRAALSGTSVSLGGINSGVFDIDGGLITAAVDNNQSLTLENIYKKYLSMFLRLGKVQRNACVIRNIGQSNAKGDFTNSIPFNFAADEAYLYINTGSGGNIYDRDGFGHTSPSSIGDSSPGIWFAAEWQRLTGQVPLYQELAFSGQPITPALTGKNNYWAPKNAIGDAAGDVSLMETWKDDFQRNSDLSAFSAEFKIQNNIAFILEGEADAAGFTSGDDVTLEALIGYMNNWLNSLSANYGVTTFAIAKIGRNGTNQTQINANAAGIQLVRDAWDSVIASRSDSYDVFPHLNHVPSPFVLNDLVVSNDGAWVSGQANQADGLHYLDVMYKAIAITSARNLAVMLGVA